MVNARLSVWFISALALPTVYQGLRPQPNKSRFRPLIYEILSPSYCMSFFVSAGQDMSFSS